MLAILRGTIYYTANHLLPWRRKEITQKKIVALRSPRLSRFTAGHNQVEGFAADVHDGSNFQVPFEEIFSS